MTKKNKRIIERNVENPFLKDKGKSTMVKTRKSWVSIGSGNQVLLDQETGETTSTNVVAVREVDDAMFVKLFTQNIGLMLDLKIQGMKALSFLIWSVQKYGLRKDIIQLDIYTRDEFEEETGTKSFGKSTMAAGIIQLIDAQILARAKKTGFYYINPDFIFNGDRVRFITEVRRKNLNKQIRLEEQGQKRLIE